MGALLGLLAAITLDFVYGRVSRYRLSATSAPYEVYAVLRRDIEYLASHYDLARPESSPPVMRLEKL